MEMRKLYFGLMNENGQVGDWQHEMTGYANECPMQEYIDWTNDNGGNAEIGEHPTGATCIIETDEDGNKMYMQVKWGN